MPWPIVSTTSVPLHRKFGAFDHGRGASRNGHRTKPKCVLPLAGIEPTNWEPDQVDDYEWIELVQLRRAERLLAIFPANEVPAAAEPSIQKCRKSFRLERVVHRNRRPPTVDQRRDVRLSVHFQQAILPAHDQVRERADAISTTDLVTVFISRRKNRGVQRNRSVELMGDART